MSLSHLRKSLINCLFPISNIKNLIIFMKYLINTIYLDIDINRDANQLNHRHLNLQLPFLQLHQLYVYFPKELFYWLTFSSLLLIQHLAIPLVVSILLKIYLLKKLLKFIFLKYRKDSLRHYQKIEEHLRQII